MQKERGSSFTSEPATGGGDMTNTSLSVLTVAKMGCPSEERIIRLSLAGLASIRALSFDLLNRSLKIIHDGEGPVYAKLEALGMDPSLIETGVADPKDLDTTGDSSGSDPQEAKSLH